MKQKWLIVGILAVLMLLVCVAGILAVASTREFLYSSETPFQETIEKTFTVDGPATLDLENVCGNTTVTGSAGNQVQVTAQMQSWGKDEEDARRQVEVQMTQQGNRITIRVVYLPHVNFFVTRRDACVEFNVRVPTETSVQLTNVSGSLAVSEITGTAELETVSGDIQAEKVNGGVKAHSTSGNITLTGLTKTGDMVVKSVSGDVALQDVTADSLAVQTVSGRIRVEGTTARGYDLESTSGDVYLDLPADAAFNLALDTVSGTIRSDFPVTVTQVGPKYVTGQVNGGGPLVRISTVSGDITLEKAP